MFAAIQKVSNISFVHYTDVHYVDPRLKNNNFKFTLICKSLRRTKISALGIIVNNMLWTCGLAMIWLICP